MKRAPNVPSDKRQLPDLKTPGLPAIDLHIMPRSLHLGDEVDGLGR